MTNNRIALEEAGRKGRPFWRAAAGASAFCAILIGADLAAGRAMWWLRERAGGHGAAMEERYRIPNARYHHDLKPNTSTDSAEWGPIRYTVRTNSLGFKDANVRDVPLASSAFRLLVIGDSFTEGVGFPFDATFAGRLATAWRGRGIEVLNAGVVSYSPVIYWKKIEDLLLRRGLHVNAVLVAIDPSDIQDEALLYQLDANGNVIDRAVPGHNWWIHNSLLFRVVRKSMWRLFPRRPLVGCVRAETFNLDCRTGWTISEAGMNDREREGLASADTHMRSLAILLRAQGIPLTIAVYPWPQQLLRSERGEFPVRHWHRLWSMARRHFRWASRRIPRKTCCTSAL